MAEPVSRLVGVDATRGFAMVGVFVAHFGLAARGLYPRLGHALMVLGLYASPTFVILSGVMLGYLLSAPPDAARRAARMMADRALFLLTVSHVLITLAHWDRTPTLAGLGEYVFMTDAIGAAVLLGVLLIPRTGARQRVALAAGLLLSSWALALLPSPENPLGQFLKRALVGDVAFDDLSPAVFSLVPWTAALLLGTAGGPRLRAALAAGQEAALARQAVFAGAAAVGTAVALKLSYLGLREAAGVGHAPVSGVWRAAFLGSSPFNKYPPGLAYLLTFGGAGLLLGGICLWLAARSRATALLHWAAVLGRASLFIFVLQFYVYYLLLPRLPLAPGWLLGVWAGASVAGLWGCAWAWNRWVGNRVLTVGLRSR